jgi:hypothetical protein
MRYVGFADADEELAEVFSFKHAQQCARGVLDPIDDVFTALNVVRRRTEIDTEGVAVVITATLESSTSPPSAT